MPQDGYGQSGHDNDGDNDGDDSGGSDDDGDCGDDGDLTNAFSTNSGDAIKSRIHEWCQSQDKRVLVILRTVCQAMCEDTDGSICSL